ncbi:MAG: carbohydrate ABC transporter permease [Candidatus Limnocylindria bacterium]|jgi:alpha-glucoside transport system permease protein
MDGGTILLAVIVVVGVPTAAVLYILAAERLLGLVPEKRRAAVRPWLWLLPGFGFLFIFLIYPTIQTIFLSFQDARSENFVGAENYFTLFNQGGFWQVIVNNALWIVFFTGVVVTLGLIIAVLTDRVRYETGVKALIFLPLAISFVAAGVIWNFMYAFDGDIGTLNAGLGAVGVEQQSWLTEWPRNTFMLIVVGIWMWVGFAMVILSAGLKGISTELLEAARMDGATELQVFFRIILPLLAPTIAVVGTTIVITALKTFDIVYVMTAGNFGTEVLASRFYSERFISRDAGTAAAVAIILLLAIIPVMLFNIRRFRAQEAIR